MRGYPIGGFLFWQVSNLTVQNHAFYGFIKNYDQRPPNNLCPRLGEIAASDSRFAILDGQQRLTSLNIGLRGSHTVKLANKWWDNPDAFPKRLLYLDLLASAPDPEESGADEETGDTERYVFRFRTPMQVEVENSHGRRWMPGNHSRLQRQENRSRTVDVTVGELSDGSIEAHDNVVVLDHVHLAGMAA